MEINGTQHTFKQIIYNIYIYTFKTMKHDITQPDTTCVWDRCLTRVQLKNECRIQPAIAYNIFSHLKVS